MRTCRFFPLCLIVFAFVVNLPIFAQSKGDIDVERSRMLIMLKTVAQDIEHEFYDPSLKGLDWKALTEATRERIKSAKTIGEMFTAIFSLVDKLQDSHTNFIPPRMAVRLRFGFEAKPVGNEILVYEIRKGGAAERAGLKLGDQIVKLNGFSVQPKTWRKMMLYFRGLRPVSVMDMMIQRGSDGPQPLKVSADVQQQPRVLDMTNSSFDYYRLIDEYEEDAKKFSYKHYDGGIVYLGVSSFSDDEHVFRILGKELQAAKVAIVDLRDNGGGAVENLRTFAGYFESEPAVLAEVVLRKKSEPAKIRPQSPHFKGKLFILVDSNSASASEMFARYFQRMRRGTVVGDHTPGLVNASNYFPEQVGDTRVVPYGVQITVGRIRFVDGEELEGKGVAPDVACLPTAAELRDEVDACLNTTLSLARKHLGLKDAPVTVPGLK